MRYNSESSRGPNAKYPKVDQGRENESTGSDEQGGMKVDPSVRLGELRGEPLGCVPLADTMRKPQAYKATKGPL